MDPRKAEYRENWGIGEESTANKQSAKLSREHFLGLLDFHGINLKTAKILELGAGQGYLAHSMREVKISITAIDARPRPFSGEIDIHQGDVSQLTSLFERGFFQALISRDMLDERYYHQDIAKISSEISSLLGDKGIYIAKEPECPDLDIPDARKSTIAGQFQVFRKGGGFLAKDYDFSRKINI